MCEKWCEIKKMLEGFDKFYWDSEMVSNISLINDLRLSTNIHETAHSRILYKLLCAHGKEPRQFLKRFLETVELQDVFKEEIEEVEIRVEYKHIDVLISHGGKYIIIENKVNHACDQDRQLVTYINDLNSNDVYVLYLVRFDEDDHPSEKSLKQSEREKLEQEGKYKKKSYQNHILDWLRKCENEINIENVLLKSALVQYRDYIEGLFKKMECMTDKDYRDFEEKVLNISVSTHDFVYPVEKYTKAIEGLSNKTNELSKAIKLYKNSLCEHYLTFFKKETEIADSCLNDSLNIEFYIQIGESRVRFTYDFLKNEGSYVWFGAKYPLKGVEKFDEKTSDNLKKEITTIIKDEYTLDEYDNYEDCANNGFKSFYSDDEWFCKYCKNNKTAMDEIKKFKEKIEKSRNTPVSGSGCQSR